MGGPALVRQRGRQRARVLGAVRLREPDLDPRGVDQLVARQHPELGLRGHGLRAERFVSGAELVAAGECNRHEDQSGAAARGGCAARWAGDCDQGVLLRVSGPSSSADRPLGRLGQR